MARDLSLFVRVLRRAQGGRRVVAIFVASIAVTIANMFGQVRLNEWNGQFFDAVGRKDLSGFVHHLWTFLVIIAVLLALTVAQTFLQERLKFRLREWITRHLLVEWLKPMRVYQLSFAGQYGRNPDQRIQEDTRLLGDYTADLGCGIVYSLLQIIAFVGVLWALSAQVTFQMAGYDVAIPGYMVWCALAYALIGSGLTWLVGRPLIALNGERYAREAEFRFALVRVNESGESIALHGGEKDEHRHLEAALAAVVDTMRRISSSLAQLTWITSGTGWLSLVVPILVAAPAYFGGSLTLGGLIMVAGAFSQVQGAMRWFVDNFSRLADWRAAIHRVARFREALDDLPAIEEGAEEIKRALHPEGHLAFEGVRILLPDGHIVIEDATVSVMPGERVLIVGDTGGGKSTLFRAVAGLWPWGSGTILTPPPETMAFLPQRPYLPLGTLRNALSLSEPARRLLRCGRATSTRAVRSRQSHRQARPGGALGQGAVARRAGAPRLRAAAPAQAGLGLSRRGDSRARRRQPTPRHGPVRRRAEEDDRVEHRSPSGSRRLPHPDASTRHGRDGERLRLKPPVAPPPPPRGWLQRLGDWWGTV